MILWLVATPGFLIISSVSGIVNSLNAELNPICPLLALLGAHHILHINRMRVNVMYLVVPVAVCLLILGPLFFLVFSP